ncbi:MAG: bifunctional glutamate N-acetyltransferase/amino-acid acetyltransferase ArgJ, partial [Coriobacteriales bacterium]
MEQSGTTPVYTEVPGGICAVPGISACGIYAGLRNNPTHPDFALVSAGRPVTAAGVFTQNVFCAAPVSVSRSHLADGRAQAIVINSAIANAATGKPGLDNAETTAQLVAGELGCSASDVLVASTGVIGVQLDMDKVSAAVPAAAGALSADGGADAARAIMTTDTTSKEFAISYEFDGQRYTIGGMCKGSGMIMPDMATMIAVVTTDAPLDPQAAHHALKAAADASFNRVTVDSDTSTNDTCLMLATGSAGTDELDESSPAFAAFRAALSWVCRNLARKIAQDGEGATKLVTVNVTGARDDEDADLCARAIANSPLVKCAVAGHDANWGRIAAAAGKSGAVFAQEDVDIRIAGIPVLHAGLPTGFDEDEAKAAFEPDEISID